MNICIFDNDHLDADMVPLYGSYAEMFKHLFRRAGAGADWSFEVFHTPRQEYPPTFDAFDAVVLTGSRADAFSDQPWVLRLRHEVETLLSQRKKLVGVCFGHQLIALCLGAPVGRAPQGWGAGLMTYDWLTATPAGNSAAPSRASDASHHTTVALLASHQDQVFELPPSAHLLASNAFCPVAAFGVGDHVFCVQAHPEFDVAYSAYLIDKRRALLGEAAYAQCRQSLIPNHDGEQLARHMIAFIQNPVNTNPV
jgi:GMP synthase-like glutamine amidotransferase